MSPTKTQRKTQRSNPKTIRLLTYVFGAFVIIYLLFVGVRSFLRVMDLQSNSRISFVVYTSTPYIISFGLAGDVNYMITFYHNDEVLVPGGYGRYKIGSLGKLASIQEDQEILQRTFSSISSSYVDYYVSLPSTKTYTDVKGQELEMYKRFDVVKTLFSPRLTTNMSVFERLYLASIAIRKRESDFVVLRSSFGAVDDDDRFQFSEKAFQKKYKGFFYHKALRDEGAAIRLVYKLPSSARTLARVSEGQGMRVADLVYSPVGKSGKCLVKANPGRKFPKTLTYIQQHLGCEIEEKAIEGADMDIVLGEVLEGKWE